MPTLQMIFRSSLKTVQSPEDYLTGRAHPPVFDAAALDPEKMVRTAHELRADEYPPLVRMRVVDEDAPQLGLDYFEVAPGEKVFDSVAAISRIFRTSVWEKQIVVSVEDTKDAHGRPLKFEWRLLRGDPDRVTITPLNDAGTQAEIQVAWHERRPVEPESRLLSSRVDIGVFAHNGVHYSAPGFVSYFCPPCEKRVYDDQHRIVSIERVSSQGKEHYADPLLLTPGLWKDEYHYDADGRLVGWTRTRNAATEDFTRHGTLVVEKDDQGRPTKTRAVRYVRQQATPQAWPELRQEGGAEYFRYTYASPGDRLGEVSPIANPAF
jgi:hypothetical protein